MELFYVARNETVWRDHFTVSPQELIKMEAQFATRITGGLLPAINVVAAPAAELPSSRNERAFVLYLRSLGVSHDPGEPNKVGINDLEESVALDSQYAPAWDELGWRYYIEYAYGNGGPGERDKVYEVHRLQREADPNGTANSITLRAEEGDLNGAYEEAAALLKRRPDSSIAHFEMGYMLRYAGLLDEAERECDTTIKIDPGWYVFRSCAQPFILDGKYVEARKYVHLDENSGFGALLRIEIALRTGDKQDALAATSLAVENGFPLAKLVPYCFDHGSATELGKAAAELETDPRSDRDSELLYQNAATLSFCGQADAALRVLRKAIAGNYCSYPAMDKDPLFSSIRWRPEFGDLRRAGMACQQDFLAHRKLVDSQR
jgi:tetratricopeptide (TPR) repeat protein